MGVEPPQNNSTIRNTGMRVFDRFILRMLNQRGKGREKAHDKAARWDHAAASESSRTIDPHGRQ